MRLGSTSLLPDDRTVTAPSPNASVRTHLADVARRESLRRPTEFEPSTRLRLVATYFLISGALGALGLAIVAISYVVLRANGVTELSHRATMTSGSYVVTPNGVTSAPHRVTIAPVKLPSVSWLRLLIAMLIGAISTTAQLWTSRLLRTGNRVGAQMALFAFSAQILRGFAGSRIYRVDFALSVIGLALLASVWRELHEA